MQQTKENQKDMEDWVHVNVASGQGNGEVNIEVDQNNDYADRSTSIDVSTVNQVKTININKKGTNIMNVRFEFNDFAVPEGHGSCGTFDGCYFNDNVGSNNKVTNIQAIFTRIMQVYNEHKQVNIDILTNTYETYKVTYMKLYSGVGQNILNCFIPLMGFYLTMIIDATNQTISLTATKLS